MPEVVIDIERLDGGTLRIRHAAEMAQVFFRLDPSANGPYAFDDLSGVAKKDRIDKSDIKSINTTMAARTPERVWTPLFDQERPDWLTALDPDWHLFELTDDAWRDLAVERKIAEALRSMFGLGRRLSVVTKVLHMKRPELIPVSDRLVLEQVGAPSGIDQNPVRSADFIGYLRREGRRNLDGLRAIQEQLRADGFSRSQVRIFEALIWASHPATRFPNVEPLIGRWLEGARSGALTGE